MKRLTLALLAGSLVYLVTGWLIPRPNDADIPTHTITTQRLALPSPPPNLETPTVDGMAQLLAPTGRVRLQSSPSTNAPAPPVATHVLAEEASANLLRVEPDLKVYAHGRYIGQLTTNSVPGWLPAPTNPTFGDGVLTAVIVFRQNPGFITLLSPQEQLALCARVWQQRALEARGAR